jgi:hypothetical protein
MGVCFTAKAAVTMKFGSARLQTSILRSTAVANPAYGKRRFEAGWPAKTILTGLIAKAQP